MTNRKKKKSVFGTSVLVASRLSPQSLAIHHSSANLSKWGGPGAGETLLEPLHRGTEGAE